MKKSLLIVCVSCCSVNVIAQENNFYVGLGLGLADVSNSLEGNTFASGLSIVEGARLKISESNRYEVEDDTSFSYRAFGGYSLNENVSFELSVYDFGKVDATQLTSKEFSDGSSSTGSTSFELRTIAVALNALLSYPVNDRISLYTTVGGAWSQQEKKYESESFDLQIVNNIVRNIDSETYSYTEKESHFDFTYGLGTSIKISESFESRVSITGVELKNGRIFDYGLSIIYRI